MRVVVLGSGVVGVSTAYSLLRDGHEVVVVDRGAEAANFTSFANAGLVAPGHAYAWSSPAAPRKLLQSLWREESALRFRFSADPSFWKWTFKFLRQCTAERARINTQRKVRLCRYSQAALHEVVGATGVSYDGRGGGLLYLYRDPANFAAAVARMRILTDEGVELRALDPAETVKVDPALGPVQDKLAGALFAPSDESGDARLYTLALAKVCEDLGAEFHYGTTIHGLRQDGGQISAAVTDKGEIAGEAFVLCLGVFSPRIARELGAELPIYPIKGYSVTLPTAGRNNPPTVGGVDEDNLVAYAPLGERIRLTATAEFAGFSTSHRPADFAPMLRAARDLFPEAGDYDSPSYWAGLRPMTPEGTPILGPARQPNLYLNTGHGHMGWTMAAGTARITADLVAGRQPELDLTGMTLN